MNKAKGRIVAIIASFALLLLSGGLLGVAQNFKLETSVYGFNQSDFQSNKLPMKRPSGGTEPVVVRSPATLAFNGEELSFAIKATPVESAGETAETGRLMTAQEFANFATYYYLNPAPGQIARAIESLEPNKFLERDDVSSYLYHNVEYFCVGFFAEVFAANPDRVAEWQKLIERQGGNTRFWLRSALKLRDPGALAAFGVNTPSTYSELEAVYIIRGAFFASGNTVYLRNLIDRVLSVDEANISLFDAGAQAMVLLALNAPHHPLVRQTLEMDRKDANPRKRELIDDLLEKSLTEILQEVRDLDRSSTTDSPSDGRNYLPWNRRVPPSQDPFSRGPS